MGRVNTPILSQSGREALQKGLKGGKSHTFRKRCQTVLLKSEGRTSEDVGKITGMSHVSVNTWLKRFKAKGIEGLLTRPGRGRKPILSREADAEAVPAAVKANRQRISLAKAAWEAEGGAKPIRMDAFHNFLKNLAADTKG